MRLNLLLAFLISLFAFVSFKIFNLSIKNHDYFAQAAKNQKTYGFQNVALRGEIFIKDRLNNQLVTVATNKFFSNSESYKNSEYIRYYPQGFLASDVIGFLGFKEKFRVGQYGVEEYYESWLSGQTGSKNFFDFGGSKFNQGSSLILTIDKNIQFFIENKLKELVGKWQADQASAIVQDPKTGAILALAEFPNFDPNKYREYPLDLFINSNIQETFEPGSSFKPITISAALDTNSITPETTYFDSGEVQIGEYTIRNYDLKKYGYQTMTQVLEKSINTGAIFAMRKMGQDKFLEYVKRFKFGENTGIDLPGEVSGDIKNLYTKREINFATASFGQGIAVTPLQLINSYSAIANGGKLMRPYIVEKIVKPNGESIQIKPEVIAEIFDNPQTAKTLTSMLVSVIENGLIRKAKVDGYKIAGKTGTAQEAKKEGGYSEFLIHNLVGFAPADDPKFTLLLKLDRPKGVEVAAASLADTFGDIMGFLLNYYGIVPTGESSKK